VKIWVIEQAFSDPEWRKYPSAPPPPKQTLAPNPPVALENRARSVHFPFSPVNAAHATPLEPNSRTPGFPAQPGLPAPTFLRCPRSSFTVGKFFPRPPPGPFSGPKPTLFFLHAQVAEFTEMDFRQALHSDKNPNIYLLGAPGPFLFLPFLRC